jgi:hypothetical protein
MDARIGYPYGREPIRLGPQSEDRALRDARVIVKGSDDWNFKVAVAIHITLIHSNMR